METIRILIATVPSILSSIVLIVIKKGQEKAKEREDARDNINVLILKNLDATGGVIKQLTRCVKGEKPNGDLEKAFEYQTKVRHELEQTLIKIGGKTM